MAGHGRIVVWASRRGTHLGQRSCASAAEGRTYERKQSNDANRLRQPCETGAVHIWHLLVNASEALRGVVERHQPQIRSVAHRAEKDPSASPGLRETAAKPEVTSRRRDRCEAALCLHGEGLPTKEIARRLGASRNAVRRWVRAGRFVPYRRAPGSSRLDRHLPFVEARWQEGQHSATALYRELHAHGFTGGYDIVRRWAARRKRGAPARPPSTRIPSTRRITRWLTGDLAALSPEDRAFTEALCSAAPKLSQAAEVIRAFADLLRQNDPTGLTPWLDAAAATDLGGFVTGLRRDEPAVRAAIVEPWSNGPVEGQVNRLKLIKRSMYGRAGFDLLRQRVLHAA